MTDIPAERMAKLETTVDFIKDKVVELVEYQKQQNGRVARNETDIAVLKERVKLCEDGSLGKGKAASLGALFGSGVAAAITALAKIFGE